MAVDCGVVPSAAPVGRPGLCVGLEVGGSFFQLKAGLGGSVCRSSGLVLAIRLASGLQMLDFQLVGACSHPKLNISSPRPLAQQSTCLNFLESGQAADCPGDTPASTEAMSAGVNWTWR